MIFNFINDISLGLYSLINACYFLMKVLTELKQATQKGFEGSVIPCNAIFATLAIIAETEL